MSTSQDGVGTRSRVDWPTTSSWTRACVVSSMIGVTAGAAAGVIGRHLDGNDTRAQLLGLVVVLVGGLVAGVALGRLQSRAFLDVLERRSRLWVLVTVPVAAVGWAAASAPSGYAEGGSSTSSLGLGAFLLTGLLVGAAMGSLLGVVQALVLRPLVSHPWRWIAINALAWSPAVAVIFLGTRLVPDSWPGMSALIAAPVVGAAAGFVAGRILGSLVPALSGVQTRDLVVLGLLGTLGSVVLGRRLLGLSFDGSVTGRTVRLPLTYARLGERIIVLPRRSGTKHWWHNIDGRLTDVLVLLRGSWRSGVAEVVRPGGPAYDDALAAYRARWKTVGLPADQPVVIVSGLSASPGAAPVVARVRRRVRSS